MTYGTIANLKLRLDVAGTSADTQLTQILDAASNWIDELAGRGFPIGTALSVFYRESTTLVSEDGRELFLDGVVDDITLVKDGDAVTLAAVTDYVALPRNDTRKKSLLLSGTSVVRWSFGSGNLGEIEVKGDWSVPVRVEEAAYMIAEAIYRRGEKGAVTLQRAIDDAQRIVNRTGMGAVV
jgi:hypothetical protein